MHFTTQIVMFVIKLLEATTKLNKQAFMIFFSGVLKQLKNA